MKETHKTRNNRRDFVKKAFSSCAMCCFASAGLVVSGRESASLPLPQPHKFQMDSGLTMEEVFNLTIRNEYIPMMKNLMDQVGRETFLEMVRTANDQRFTRPPDMKEFTIAELAGLLKSMAEGPEGQIRTAGLIQEDDRVLEVTMTECLWAKTFREENAADLGYAAICYQDYPAAGFFNPRLRLYRDKTLMQGDDCCNNRWALES